MVPRHRPQHYIAKCIICSCHDCDWLPHRSASCFYCLCRHFNCLSRPLQGEESPPVDRPAHVLAVQTHFRSSLSYFSMSTRYTYFAALNQASTLFQLSLQLLKSIARNHTIQTSTVHPLSTPPSPDTIHQERTNI